jgi:hypothetical protein
MGDKPLIHEKNNLNRLPKIESIFREELSEDFRKQEIKAWERVFQKDMDKFKEYQENQAREDFIPLLKCKRGFLYKIHSRNLSIGVFNGKDGFIGIRTKFGNKFLFTEYHWDTGAPYGTTKPLEELCPLPDNIKCDERESHEFGSDWVKDSTGKERPTIRYDLKPGEEPHGRRQGFVDIFADTKERLPNDLYPYVKDNRALFNWLQDAEKELNDRTD